MSLKGRIAFAIWYLCIIGLYAFILHLAYKDVLKIEGGWTKWLAYASIVAIYLAMMASPAIHLLVQHKKKAHEGKD